MNRVLKRWNELPAERAAQEIVVCNGSQTWARHMTAKRPIRDAAALAAMSDEAWGALTEKDWREAFMSHPRIGESAAASGAKPRSEAWSEGEQRQVGEEND